ncbi:hypothetical protein LEP1GSC103_2320 [Leptospira borgpetersenii serovar Javanica str. UI 09931]|uniref:Uncharacterized protein n=1 Tax=Leptospira borgpetersenii serovar Javanica str. UI 09931 TaxID=1049767 RepID=A0AAV3JAL0_LEPBO|nr:hypothetical protein LEP1GSC103_2320 [Leptospira borgpetersenii serovar Javanica str. UI 09931]PTM44106.1 hypothetical protein CLV95_11564 [Leptospira borgpetersenii serovar Javanica]
MEPPENVDDRNGCANHEFKLPKAKYPATARTIGVWMYGLMVLILRICSNAVETKKTILCQKVFFYFQKILLGE